MNDERWEAAKWQIDSGLVREKGTISEADTELIRRRLGGNPKIFDRFFFSASSAVLMETKVVGFDATISREFEKMRI